MSMVRLSSLGQLQVGSVVAVNMGLYWHKGLVSEIWGPSVGVRVIHASKEKGMVVEESLNAFAGGRPVSIWQLRPLVPVRRAVASAREQVGRRYAVFSANCEHLVTGALGYRAQSPQARSYLTLAAGIGLVALLGSGKR